MERLTNHLELPTVFKDVIRLNLGGLLVSVSMDRSILVQLLANRLLLGFWLLVDISAVSSIMVFGEFIRDVFRVS